MYITNQTSRFHSTESTMLALNNTDEAFGAFSQIHKHVTQSTTMPMTNVTRIFGVDPSHLKDNTIFPSVNFTQGVELMPRATVPVYGLPGNMFYALHITGCVSITISILFSSGVLIYLLCPYQYNIWQRKIGERLVIYLATCDLLWSISHLLDHAYMLALNDHPPRLQCTIFGFLLAMFSMCQAVIITFTGFSAFILVVKEIHINLGRHDWRLLALALGFPLVMACVPLYFNLLGPSGAW